MLLEEAVDVETVFEAEQAADFGFGETIVPVAFEGDGFKGSAGGILAGGDEAGGNFFRDVDRDGHGDAHPYLNWPPAGGEECLVLEEEGGEFGEVDLPVGPTVAGARGVPGVFDVLLGQDFFEGFDAGVGDGVFSAAA